MTWQRLRIRNFQSLRDVDLELGPLTVIVGPSSSGKTALIRAARLLVFNARGASYVSEGARVASVSASTQDWTATIERGDGHGNYKLQIGEDASTFTKLGGGVPDEVRQVLGVDERSFASQFDRPYLLDESGAEVARELGTLTNVSVILEGAREASRRRQSLASTLKTRESDLSTLMERLQDYAVLGSQLKAQDRAEEILVQASAVESQRARLADLLVRHEIARETRERTEASLPKVPSTEVLDEAIEARDRFVGRLRALGQARAETVRTEGQLQTLAEALQQAEQALHDTLVREGTCPLCNQSTKGL